MLQTYSYLEVGGQLCHPHYCKVLESIELNNNSIKPNDNTGNTISSALLRVCNLELDLLRFKRMIEDANSQLKDFFNYMINLVIPKERSAYNINERDVFHIYNINDYHAIHEIRRLDTVSTSAVKYFVTYVAKPVTGFQFVPLTFNGKSIHNLSNVES
ncbi:14262_t:CDS:2 [Funneliformis caledonium]|uniref:14262_t:CDS:1 n=1 Tax=Funneliformis caledonium TaxID=1117310 RepID=A0A9N9CQB3_9GLOM|nr:14262_t:CDS:2 [Funneliformis caledonium]